MTVLTCRGQVDLGPDRLAGVLLGSVSRRYVLAYSCSRDYP